MLTHQQVYSQLCTVTYRNVMPLCTNSLGYRPTVKHANMATLSYADHQAYSDENPVAPPRRKKSSSSTLTVSLSASDIWATLPKPFASATSDMSLPTTPHVPPRRQNCHLKNGNDLLSVPASPQSGDHTREVRLPDFDNELAARTSSSLSSPSSASSSWLAEVTVNHAPDNESILSLRDCRLLANNASHREDNERQTTCSEYNGVADNGPSKNVFKQEQSICDTQFANDDAQIAASSKWRDRLFDECLAWNDTPEHRSDHSEHSKHNRDSLDRNRKTTLLTAQSHTDKRHDQDVRIPQGQGQEQSDDSEMEDDCFGNCFRPVSSRPEVVDVVSSVNGNSLVTKALSVDVVQVTGKSPVGDDVINTRVVRTMSVDSVPQRTCQHVTINNDLSSVGDDVTFSCDVSSSPHTDDSSDCSTPSSDELPRGTQVATRDVNNGNQSVTSPRWRKQQHQTSPVVAWSQGDLATYCGDLLAWQQRYRLERQQRQLNQQCQRPRNKGLSSDDVINAVRRFGDNKNNDCSTRVTDNFNVGPKNVACLPLGVSTENESRDSVDQPETQHVETTCTTVAISRLEQITTSDNDNDNQARYHDNDIDQDRSRDFKDANNNDEEEATARDTAAEKNAHKSLLSLYHLDLLDCNSLSDSTSGRQASNDVTIITSSSQVTYGTLQQWNKETLDVGGMAATSQTNLCDNEDVISENVRELHELVDVVDECNEQRANMDKFLVGQGRDSSAVTEVEEQRNISVPEVNVVNINDVTSLSVQGVESMPLLQIDNYRQQPIRDLRLHSTSSDVDSCATEGRETTGAKDSDKNTNALYKWEADARHSASKSHTIDSEDDTSSSSVSCGFVNPSSQVHVHSRPTADKQLEDLIISTTNIISPPKASHPTSLSLVMPPVSVTSSSSAAVTSPSTVTSSPELPYFPSSLRTATKPSLVLPVIVSSLSRSSNINNICLSTALLPKPFQLNTYFPSSTFNNKYRPLTRLLPLMTSSHDVNDVTSQPTGSQNTEVDGANQTASRHTATAAVRNESTKQTILDTSDASLEDNGTHSENNNESAAPPSDGCESWKQSTVKSSRAYQSPFTNNRQSLLPVWTPRPFQSNTTGKSPTGTVTAMLPTEHADENNRPPPPPPRVTSSADLMSTLHASPLSVDQLLDTATTTRSESSPVMTHSDTSPVFEDLQLRDDLKPHLDLDLDLDLDLVDHHPPQQQQQSPSIVRDDVTPIIPVTSPVQLAPPVVGLSALRALSLTLRQQAEYDVTACSENVSMTTASSPSDSRGDNAFKYLELAKAREKTLDTLTHESSACVSIANQALISNYPNCDSAVRPQIEAEVTSPSYSYTTDSELKMQEDEDVSMEVSMLKGAFGTGFCIEGGTDCPSGSAPIRVKRIFRADSCLLEGDVIQSVNGTSFISISHFDAWKYLKSLPAGRVTFGIRRK